MGKTTTPTLAVMRLDDKCVWLMADEQTYETQIEKTACWFCFRRVVVELPPPLKAIQPDDTTHVCHPAFGGCNHGYAVAAQAPTAIEAGG